MAYAGGPLGAYSEARVMPADRLLRLPEDVDERRAAAMMLKGLTVQYLIRRTYRVKAGETVLWHAAAGGVGLIACQWLKALGATVIGTAGSEEKAALAKAHGADHVILYDRESVPERVKALTGGKGVPVVYDSVGQVHLRRLPRRLAAARAARQLRQRLRARCSPSICRSWRRRVRSTSPVPLSTPTPRSERTSRPWRPSCSRWSARAA